MPIRIVRLGSPRTPREGLRIGTVRRPPRGVPKSELAARDLYDVWLPNLAPSEELLEAALGSLRDERAWRRFVRRYRAQMNRPEVSRIWDLLAALSHSANLSIGCYCEDESRCHRSIMRELLERHCKASDRRRSCARSGRRRTRRSPRHRRSCRGRRSSNRPRGRARNPPAGRWRVSPGPRTFRRGRRF